MPPNSKHCEHTKKRYGVTGFDIHSWMDEPSLILGSNHRVYRHYHDLEIPKCFIDIYGEELARNIMLDHIYLDTKSGEIRKTILERNEADYVISFPVDFLFDECPYEYRTREWYHYHRIKELDEIIEKIVIKHIKMIEGWETPPLYYYRYPDTNRINLNRGERKMYVNPIIKEKLDKYYKKNNVGFLIGGVLVF